MVGEHLDYRARRVVTGLDADGRSTFVVDEETPHVAGTPAFAVNAVWQMPTLPAPTSDYDSLQGEVRTQPPSGGLNYFISVFPPDADFPIRATYEELESVASGDFQLRSESPVPGMHSTETIDIVTVISGEIYAIVETGETLLRAGDTIVQRGTNHAWSNRTAKPCVISAVHIDAIRPAERPGVDVEAADLAVTQ